jgi:hypothetical protein
MEVPMANSENGLGVASAASVNTGKVPESGPLQTRAGEFSFPGSAAGRKSNYHMMISNVQAPPPPTRSGAPSAVQVNNADAFVINVRHAAGSHIQALHAATGSICFNSSEHQSRLRTI